MPVPDNQNLSDARIVSGILVTTGLICALVTGTLIGSDDPSLLILGFGVASVMAALIALQTNIWILIPMFWYLTGRLGFAPLPFSVRDIMVLAGVRRFCRPICYARHSRTREIRTSGLARVPQRGLSGNRFRSKPGRRFRVRVSRRGRAPLFGFVNCFPGVHRLVTRYPAPGARSRYSRCFFVLPKSESLYWEP